MRRMVGSNGGGSGGGWGGGGGERLEVGRVGQHDSGVSLCQDSQRQADEFQIGGEVVSFDEL